MSTLDNIGTLCQGTEGHLGLLATLLPSYPVLYPGLYHVSPQSCSLLHSLGCAEQSLRWICKILDNFLWGLSCWISFSLHHFSLLKAFNDFIGQQYEILGCFVTFCKMSQIMPVYRLPLFLNGFLHSKITNFWSNDVFWRPSTINRPTIWNLAPFCYILLNVTNYARVSTAFI